MYKNKIRNYQDGNVFWYDGSDLVNCDQGR